MSTTCSPALSPPRRLPGQDSAFTPDPAAEGAAAGRASPPAFAFEAVSNRAIAALLRLADLPRLVLVTAPSGYGKTVTLSLLHAHCVERGLRCLWVTLDSSDTDLPDLLHLLHLALRLEGGSLGAIAHRGALMDTVVASLCRVDTPTVLFIDDLGFCRDPRLGPLLESLVFRTNGRLRLVIASVATVPIDVVRAKLELNALEIHGAHLRFDRESTARVLQAGPHALSSADLDRIQEQTEGWPAAVRLLQVLMSSAAQTAASADGDEARTVLDRFGGDQRDMARLLASRALAGFDAQLVAFMLEVALAREFSVSLAQHMTGRDRAREWMDLLLGRNVLIFPVDRKQQWFRFHTLMREYLLAEGRQSLDPERRREVLSRAAHWHAEQGDHLTALEIALDAPAVALATRLVDQVAGDVVGDQGRMAPYIRWYERLLGAGGTPSLNAHAWYVWALCHALHYERTRQALDALDRRIAGHDPQQPTGPALRSHLNFLRLVIGIYLDRIDDAGARAHAWLDSDEPRNPLSQGTAFAVASVAALETGDMTASRRLIASARAAMTRAGSHWGLAWDDAVLAIIEINAARPDLADRILGESRERAHAELGEASEVLAILDFVQARADLDLGRASQAAQYARAGLARATDLGLILTAEQGLLACVALWTPDGREGPRAEQIDQVANSYPPRLGAVVSAGWVRRLLALGQVTRALELARASGLDAAIGDAPHGERMLAWIEVALAQGHDRQAQDRIDSLLKAPHLQQRLRDRVELWLAACEMHQRAGHDPRAIQALARAVGLAAAGQLLQPFRHREPCLRALIAAHPEREFGLIQPQELAFLGRLRSLFTADPLLLAPGAFDAPTSRELQLLELLDEGLNNQQMADQLSLSLNTVKWHLRNLYVKLGVGHRSAALAKARAHRMLPQ